VIKALVFDLDDSLLNRNKRVSSKNQEALLACIDEGITVIIATSRPKRAVIDFLDESLLKRVCLITLNGAIYEIDGKVTKVSSLGTMVSEILSKTEMIREPIISIEYFGLEFSTNKNFNDDDLWKYQSATREMIVSVNEENYSSVCKIAVDGQGEYIGKYVESIQGLGINAICAVNHSFVNIVEAGVDKSHTVIKVAKIRGIDMENIISFGDDIPDIEMMKITGTSVAMGNAIAQVKEVASTIIGDCDSDAISQYIHEFILKKHEEPESSRIFR
jgi:Cof subfamily protein (haloacid dehalogenase superfamily)